MMRARSPRSVVTTYRMRSRGDIAKVTVFSGCSASSKSTENGLRMKLDDLSREERRRRQDEITTELLDIVTGAEAVAGER